MPEDLNTRLTRIIEQKRLKQKFEQDLGSVEKDLQAQSSRLEALGMQLKKEQVDVDKLEHTSLTSLFHSVLGSREQQLEKERQELLSAQLTYQQTKHQVDFLKQEQFNLSGQLEKLKGIESEYEMMLSEKEQYLRQTNQSAAGELIARTEQITHLNSESKEINEAIQAGKNVLEELEQVIGSLDSAEGWGTWDLLGGDIISTAIKHSRIDDARNGIQVVQAQMSRFKRELADVQQSTDLVVEVDTFETFADYFFDGLIIDWIVQSKIVDALERANQAKEAIGQTIINLESLEKCTQDKIRELQEKRRLLIENT